MSTPGTRLIRRDDLAPNVTLKPKRPKRQVVAEFTPFGLFALWNVFAFARLDAARHFGHRLSVVWDGATLTVYAEDR